jgi:hypothetical protein
MTDPVPIQARRSSYDVSDRINVTDPSAVADEICRLMADCCPDFDCELLTRAVTDFARLYSGDYPGRYACDTLYHDLQHTLDVTLAMARLAYGHERSEPQEARFGAERIQIGLIAALFHDAGYIRRAGVDHLPHGAEYTLTHVTRSGEFLAEYLPTVGLEHLTEVARNLVQFTGYERDIKDIEVPDERYRRLGKLLGTADLIAQLADRCYLEKCRDRLYPEFVLGGIARSQEAKEGASAVYSSPEDLLRKTPQYFDEFVRERLNGKFDQAYRYAAQCFDGRNFYIEAIEKNVNFLEHLIASNRLDKLRRQPPRNKAAGRKRRVAQSG